MSSKHLLTLLSTTLALILFCAGSASSDEALSGEQVQWQVVASGSASGSSENFSLSGTTGQTAAGSGSSTDFQLRQGYWQNFGGGTPCLCGDADGSGFFNISDAVFLISYIFAGSPVPDPICLGDANGDAIANISDAVFMISFIFGGGTAPHCS